MSRVISPMLRSLLTTSAVVVGFCFGQLIAAEPDRTATPPSLTIPAAAGPFTIDARLDADIAGTEPLLADYRVAGDPDAAASPTRTWLRWSPAGLSAAFHVVDADGVARGPAPNEHDVDTQDRVELFLWSGDASDRYYCLEVSPRNAVHAYAAKFYRQFDDAWHPQGFTSAASLTDDGYIVEFFLPAAAIREMGFHFAAKETLRGGLFRADCHPDRIDDPTWICWVEGQAKPDFHTAGSFGEFTLAPQAK